MPKTVTITIPDEEKYPEIIASFSPEENMLMLKIGSSCILEGQKAVASLSQKEICKKIKEESKEEVKKLELDLIVQREMSKKMEEKIGKIYEGQVDLLKKQIESMRDQLRVYESENREKIQKEVNKVKEKYELLMNEKDRQNQLNREVFDKAEKLINKSVSKSSIEMGDDGENIFQILADTFKDFSGYKIENKAKQGHKGDFHLFFDDFNVLVDLKNYTGSVQKKEVIKIENDLISNDNMNFAWMVSLNTNISDNNRFPISCKWIDTDGGKKCILFINNLLENKEPKNVLRQAWAICSELNRLTKNVDKEDGELLIYREKHLFLQKQIKSLQERTLEIRKNVNASLNVIKHMDNDLIEMLALVTNDIITNRLETTNKITEWWDTNIEYTNESNKLTSTEIWSKFKKENKDYVTENKLTVESFRDAITSIVDSSTYAEKTKKGAVEFTGFKFRENVEDQIVVKPIEKKIVKSVKTEKLKIHFFDEAKDSAILTAYEDETKDIMQIGVDNNVKTWQVVSVLMRHGKIKKRVEARGHDIYKDTEEYKQKIGQ